MRRRPLAVGAALAALVAWLLAVELFSWPLFFLGLVFLLVSVFFGGPDPRTLIPSGKGKLVGLGLVVLVVLGGAVSLAGVGFGPGAGVALAGGEAIVAFIVLVTAFVVVVAVFALLWLAVETRPATWRRAAYIVGVASLIGVALLGFASAPEDPEATPAWARVTLGALALTTVAMALLPHITWFDEDAADANQR